MKIWKTQKMLFWIICCGIVFCCMLISRIYYPFAFVSIKFIANRQLATSILWISMKNNKYNKGITKKFQIAFQQSLQSNTKKVYWLIYQNLVCWSFKTCVRHFKNTFFFYLKPTNDQLKYLLENKNPIPNPF